MKKYIVSVLVCLSALLLAACTGEGAVLDEAKVYEITSDIHSVRIEIHAADFVIEPAEEFSVESNLKALSVSEKDGVLTVRDKTKASVSSTDAMLKLRMPDNVVLEAVDITTGAAKLTADSLSAKKVKLQLGAGAARFGCLNAQSSIDIRGGAGEITVQSGTLQDLSLALCVGELNMTAALLGESDLEFGIGESHLTLLGKKRDYRLEAEKGLGTITVNGSPIGADGSSGNGPHHVEIEGGIGAIHITLPEE